MNHRGIFYIIMLALLVSCEPNLSEDFTPDAGKADFSKYVAIGNSLTAGYADGALYRSGQQYSFPAILAEQMAAAGGGSFTQPLIGTEEGVGIESTQQGPVFRTKRILGLVEVKNCEGEITGMTLQPVPLNPDPDQQLLQQQLMSPPETEGPYNNMGVPGAKVQHLLFDQYGNPQAVTPGGTPLYNPYFVRFASTPNTTVINDAIAQDPTFYTLWIGANDILTSALEGTDSLITPPEIFAGAYDAVVQTLMGFDPQDPPKGVLANIPDITSIPYFTTISSSLPYNALTLTAEQAQQLTAVYQGHGHSHISFEEGPNPFIIEKSDGTIGPMQPGDLFLLTLPTAELECAGMGAINTSDLTPYPIPGKYVLDANEVQSIKDATAAYNQAIASYEDSPYNLPVLDVNTLMRDFESGMNFDGITYTTEFVQGGLFSLDGVHLNQQGNALLANFFIEEINKVYNANLSKVVVSNYPGIEFP